MSLTKQQLEALNNNSFPNNNAGAITPDILRTYNAAVIEALVDSNSTASFATTGSNTFTGTQIVTGSVYVNGNIYATNLTGSGNVNTSSLVTTASFNAYTSSQDFKNTTFATTSSVTELSQSLYFTDTTQSANLTNLSSSVAQTDFTQSYQITANALTASTALTNYSSSQSTLNNTLSSSIATNSSSIGLLQTFSGSQYKADSSSFSSRINAITGSGGSGTGATTGSNSFTGSQTINGNIILTGSSAEIQNAKGVGIFNSLYNLDYKLAMPIQNTIGYIDELNLPHYYNGGVQPTISASATINNHNLVKVTPQQWFNLTASVGDNHTGILSVEQSTGWNDINNTFGVHGNYVTSGSVNYITQRGLSKIGIFPLGGNPTQPYIGQPIYVDDNGYQLTTGYPTGSRVLRYGYVASFEQSDPGNMYIRQIFVDPVWEKGETITDLNVSSSLRVTGSLNVTGSTNFSELTGSLTSFSSSIDSRILAIPTINTGSFAITGSNQFNGNQTITGSLFVSSSNTSDIVVNGQVFISSSVSSSAGTAKLTISGSAAIGSSGNRTSQIVITPTGLTLSRATTPGPTSVGFTSQGGISTSGPNATISANVNTGSNTATIGTIFQNDTTLVYNSMQIASDTNGSYLKDFDNTLIDYSPFMYIAPNDGVTIPPVEFLRAVNFTTGSNQQAGTATLNGGNPGTVTVSNSLVTSNSIIMLTKQTLGNAHSVAITAKSGGSFTITSTGNGDSDVVGWFIINNS